MIGDEIPQATSEDIIERLFEIELVTERETRLMKAVIQRNVLSFNVQIRDQLRAKILQAMVIALLYK